jgi:hypothetical protein
VLSASLSLSKATGRQLARLPTQLKLADAHVRRFAVSIYFFVLGIFGVWRITHLLSQEAGPGDILAKFRRSPGPGIWGGLLDCFYCLSIWVSVPFALVIGKGWMERVLLWPALSGAAILAERLSAGRQARAVYVEEGEEEDVLR